MASHLEIDLDGWYEEDREDRIRQIYTPDHTAEEVGENGLNLAGHSGKGPEHAEKLPEDARQRGLVGHGQKLARARDEDFRPKLSRRDFDATGEPGLHFNSWQRRMEQFVEVREAMNAEEYGDELDVENNGILEYVEVKSRATFLIPPRRHRALPPPDPREDG